MNPMMNPMKKCSGCCCFRIEDEYIYGNKINKSCIKCRDKRKKNRYKKKEPNEEPNEEPNDLTNYIRHQRLFRKLNNEFLERAGKAVHIYQMKYAFVDIRDCRIYSDKDFTYTNY